MNKRIVFSTLLLTALFVAAPMTYARWMNPSTGRFHTMDTFDGEAQEPLSLHKYFYCRANPIDLIDPSGLEVAVYSHRVTLTFWSHANIRLYPDNTNSIPAVLLTNTPASARGWRVDGSGRFYATIGAGPDDSFSRLTSHLNRKRDLANPQNGNRFEFLVDSPNGLSNDQFIVRLLRAEKIYVDTAHLGYSIFPALSEYDYNSNSYISGLLQAVTGRDYSGRLGHAAAGWRKPVPPMWFEPVPGMELTGMP